MTIQYDTLDSIFTLRGEYEAVSRFLQVRHTKETMEIAMMDDRRRCRHSEPNIKFSFSAKSATTKKVMEARLKEIKADLIKLGVRFDEKTKRKYTKRK